LKAVREKAPKVVFGPVQELLKETVGAGLRGTSDARRSPIEVHVTAYEVDGRILPQMRDRKGLAADFKRLCPQESAIPQLLKQREKPLFPGHSYPRIRFLEVCGCRLEGSPYSN
jgi:hypothetical protein